ncbi:glutaredoxin [Undibacterium sp. Jales W-56]|uniref:glutaredoxin n=1 Tax=Undibacterium sp. Jales W-56 TaxID=2897325 RepID=UPI0021CE4D26|nr:glutaredoxin [Undibacterium sp. Jales W-56]MCU6435253.1 glutaredoxin [Undibacterium sp. Jales W-56]
MIDIDVFVLPGCERCLSGLGALEQVVRSFGPDNCKWEERNLLENIDRAVQIGILSAPAIAVGGRLAFSSLPSPQQLHAELVKYVTGP